MAVARAQVENAKATIAQREAQLAQAEIDLERTRIRSPIDGTVIARTVDVGQTVAASLQAPELFKIAQDLRRIRIEAQVSEADVGSVAAGNPVEFRVDAYPERRFQGRVAQVRLGGIELNNVVTYTVIIEAANDRPHAAARHDRRGQDRKRQAWSGRCAFPSMRCASSRAARRRWRRRATRRSSGSSASWSGSSARWRSTERAGGEGAAIMKGHAGRAGGQAGGGSAVASGGKRPGARGRARVARHAAAGAGGGRRHHAMRSGPPSRRGRRAREAAAGRGSRRDVTVWVLNASGAIESAQVDLGLVDDHFAEVLGDALKEGDRVVLRSRQVGKQ